MVEHDEASPHLARFARHPLPKGEGDDCDFWSLYPAKGTGKDQGGGGGNGVVGTESSVRQPTDQPPPAPLLNQGGELLGAFSCKLVERS